MEEVRTEGPIIEEGDRVLIRYRVSTEKEVVDSAKEPVWIEVGTGNFMPAVEKSLIGRRPGEIISVLVPPQEHYGPYDPKKLQLVPVEKVPQGVNPGAVIKLQDEYGVVHPAVLKKVDEGLAVVDFNHPLAGKTLRFDVEIIDVQKRSQPEKEQEETREGRSEG